MVPFGLGALLADPPEGGEEIRLAMIELPMEARPRAIPPAPFVAGWCSSVQISADLCGLYPPPSSLVGAPLNGRTTSGCTAGSNGVQ